MQTVSIHTEMITLGQLLKKLEIVQTGGHAKIFLEETLILVNGEEESRRGRKLYPQDTVDIEGMAPFRLIRS
ncbi:S4 domain protein YaaA [Marininema mesophilum]|uniref:S4 domain protein YaaA n=1 Tax=Marininema mesophilum TaxID=1048340 RepID=A0A1H3ADG4_9BACL|nr:S4 domain-containing protein YaaA [Marininema mesophilum]SDX27703.1 S4 domain protein YaaA [Marininema mesophilum]